jgi:hypothetical protein
MMATIAERLFDAHDAAYELERLLENVGVEFQRLGWDWYDRSVEVHGVAPNARLSIEAQRAIHEAGFSTAYVNHTDKWETHYHFKPEEPFVESKGWRVSYPHKRGNEEQGIWVEEHVASWPQAWFDSGYVQIKPPLR